MTGQDLLDRMELLNAELQLQSGETDVTRGLLALNVAQDYFESLAALRGKIFGSATGTVQTSASTESTAFPTGVLRIDKLQLLDSSSLPKRTLTPRKKVGSHRLTANWPYNLIQTTSTGEPTAYWTNGTSIYWDPLPSGTSTVRWYGFQVASNITAGGTFAYPDIVAFPIAAFACQIIKLGLEDSTQDIGSMAAGAFKPVLDTLTLFQRDGAASLEYTETHLA